ncbi:hypothetical protein D3C78_1380970 [compost metagenome]
MLGADAAGEFGRHVVDDGHQRLGAGLEVLVGHAQRLAQVVVQVAVADVPVGDDAHAGQCSVQTPAGDFDEIRDAADRHADVMLEARPFVVLRLGDALAQRPQRRHLGLAAGDHRIDDRAALEGLAQTALQQLA